MSDAPTSSTQGSSQDDDDADGPAAFGARPGVAPRWDLILRHLCEGVVVCDASGWPVHINRRALKLMGLTSRQVRGLDPMPAGFQFYAANGSPLAFADLPLAVTMRTGMPLEEVTVGVERPGERMQWMSINTAVVRDGEHVEAFVTTFRDATEQTLRRDIDRATRDLATRLVEAPLGKLSGEATDAHLASLGKVANAARVLYVALDHASGRASMTNWWSSTDEPPPVFDGGLPIDLLAPLLRFLAKRTPIVVPDVNELAGSDLLSVPIEHWGIVAAVIAPVVVDEHIDGFLLVGWAQPQEPGTQLVDFALVTADLLAARLGREREHADLDQARRQLEEQMRMRSADLVRAQQRAHLFLDVLPDLLVELDDEGRLIDYHAPHSIDGDLLQFLHGVRIADIFGGSKRDELDETIERLRTSNEIEVFDFEWPDGDIIRQFQARFMREGNGTIIAVIREATGTAERERRAREYADHLKRVNDELQRVIQERDEFLGGVSHELRTPLNAILGMTEMLLDEQAEPLSSPQRMSLHTIDASGRELLELINDLLDFSELRTRAAKLDLRSVPLAECCELSVELIRPRALRKGQQLEWVDASHDATVVADERRVRQVLLNLLDNAVKFTPPGGTLGVQVWKPDNRHVAVCVWDTGPGIAAPDQVRIFEPFAHARNSDGGEGSGLGLSLVERLVALHDGTIDLDSELGRGSRFTVMLPVDGPATGMVKDPDPI